MQLSLGGVVFKAPGDRDLLKGEKPMRLSRFGPPLLCGLFWASTASLYAASPGAADSPSWCSVPRQAIPRDAVATVVKEAQSKLDDQPHPLSEVHVSGLLPHQGHSDEAKEAKKDLPLMRSAALAWYAGAGDQYLAMANRYLMAWINTYQPTYKAIDEAGFDPLIDTYAMIRDHMDPSDQAKAAEMLRKWAKGYISQIDSHPEDRQAGEDKWDNNFQSHRIKLITMIAVALGDRKLFDQAQQLFWKHLSINMKPDGSVLDFYRRDAVKYVDFDLEGMLRGAMAARAYGEDWYHRPAANGASLEKGVQWLLPYANGEKTHQEFVHSDVAFDAQRASAGVEGMSGPYDPKDAAKVMRFAALFDPQYRSLAESLSEKETPFLTICGQ